ncbi:transposase [Nocardioides sp. L-11A]|uniref:transposase n=1 Tax=Nocardioides sp. L-11A TaxID=3043848 RepID=UPI0037095E31
MRWNRHRDQRTGISKSDHLEVSRICAGLDEEVGAFRDRSLAEIAYPYVFLEATYCKARVHRRVVSQGEGDRDRYHRGRASLRSSGSMAGTAQTGRSGPRSCGV